MGDVLAIVEVRNPVRGEKFGGAASERRPGVSRPKIRPYGGAVTFSSVEDFCGHAGFRFDVVVREEDRGPTWIRKRLYLTTFNCGRGRLPPPLLPSAFLGGRPGRFGGSGPRSDSENTMPSPVSRA